MRTIFSLVMLCLIQISYAQKTDFLWSPVMDYKFKNEEVNKVLSYDDKGLYILRKGGELPAWYQIEKYKSDLSLAYKTPLELGKKGVRDNKGYLSSMVSNGVAYGFFYHWDDAASTYNVVSRKVSETGELEDEVIIGKDAAEKFGKAPEYKFITSADGSKFAAIGLMPFEKESNERWHVLIYEVSGMKKILDKTLDCLVPRERFEINDMMLTSSGSLQVFKMWDVKKMGKFSAIVTVKADGSVKKTDLDLGNKAISFRKVFVNKNGYSSVVGFINPDDKDWKRISGHFYFSVDDNGTLKNNTVESLGEMVLSQVYYGLTKGKAEKEDQPIKEYEFTDILETENGELTLFIEFYSQLVKSGSTDPTNLISTYDKTHKNMIAIRLDKDGKKLWSQKLEKKQEYSTKQTEKFWGGVVPLMSGTQTFLLWNHINFPEIPGKLAQATQGWYDAAKQKHYVYEEYGNRAAYATCLSSIDEKGSLMYGDQPVPFAIPLIAMYKNAVYNVTFSSSLFARYKNSVILFMEMPAGMTAGATKYQFCKVTVSE